MELINQNKLYGLDIFFEQIKNLFAYGKLPNKILLNGKKGIGKYTLAKHVINYILSLNEESSYDLKNLQINEENRSYKLIKNHTHPNFYLIDLIDVKKNIEIGQIRKMIDHMNKSNFNTKPRFVLINNVENLNINSSNALLKIVEEPNENMYFILIHNNSKKILTTLKSRCLSFNINLTFDETTQITNRLIGDNLDNIMHKELISHYFSAGDFISLINFSVEHKVDLKKFNLPEFLSFIINGNYYKKETEIKNLLINYIELYILNVYKLSKSKNNIFNLYKSITSKFYNANKYNLDEESLFIEFKSRFLNE